MTATTPTSTTPTPSEPASQPHRELHLLAAGCILWLLLASGILLLALANPEQARAVTAGLVAELLGGREAGIPVGLAAGASPWFVWPVSAAQDMGTALLSYPVFLYLLHRYQDSDRYVMRRLRAMQRKAAEHEAFVHRWGPLGIGLFMLVPFLVNGPFIGLVLGRLTGIRTQHLLGPVVAATIITAGLWTFFFDALIQLLDVVHPHIGWILAGAAVGIVAVLGIVDFAREWRTHRNASADSDA